MAPHRAISKGRGSTQGAHRPRAEEASVQLDMLAVAYSKAPKDHHNHFSHDGTHDPEVSHIFKGNVPLFLKGSSQERIETIRTGFVNEDTPINEVSIVPNTFGNEIVQNDAQYPFMVARFPNWIKSTDA
ncbi:uncharacterized protein A4U43_C09F11010 [Asparagus officinalis]|uniref:Uncharacterized protein n=1 Tax=Asparagus officinalis TaxID=4686 RepID=A0A5P1E6Q6_ASPOF|nr:uncharacterized protein A4U43_C09F11010 [Asparagus officinalis]